MRKFLFSILIIFLFFSCKSPPPVIEELLIAESEAEEPELEPEIVPVIEILEPVFEVVSIVILQADIVVTRFQTVLRIENPNSFAVDLSSIAYELYGNGVFWADGAERNILHIPALSTNEVRFIFNMNFIGQSRRLLDDILAMRQVNYRFKGQAFVSLYLHGAPGFTADFDISGLSDVRRN